MAVFPDNLPTQGAILLCFLVHIAVVGFALNRRLGLWQDADDQAGNAYLRWFFALSSGLLADIALLFLLGASGWLTRAGVLAGSLVLAGASVFTLAPKWNKPQWLASLRGAALLEGLSVGVLLLIVVSSAVRVPGHWDDTMYHLPLARFYVEHQSLALHEFVRFPLMPQNVDLLFAFGLVTGGEVLAQAMATLPVFVMSLGLIGAGVWVLGSPVPGFLAVLALLEIGPIRMTRGYAYVDNGLGLFCWGAVLALAIWNARSCRSRGWLALAGLLAGGAAGTKLFGAVFAVVLWLFVIGLRREWRAALLFASSALLSGSWWYIRSAILSGDPIHPAGGPLFGYFLWNADDLVRQRLELATFGVEPGVLAIWPALVEAGVSLWAPAFFSFLAFRKSERRLLILPAVFVSYFAFWFFVVQVQRYLAPVYALASLLSVLVVYRWIVGPLVAMVASRQAWLRDRRIPALLCLLPLLYFLAGSWQSASTRLARWDRTLAARPAYTLFSEADGLRPVLGSRLVQVGFEGSLYFFRGIAIGDWFGPGRYAGMLDCSSEPCRLVSPSVMAGLMDRFNCRMLAVNTDRFAIDIPAYQPLFDVRRQTKDGVLLIRR